MFLRYEMKNKKEKNRKKNKKVQTQLVNPYISSSLF